VGSQALSEILVGTSNLNPMRVVVLPILVESESSRLLGISSAVLKGMDGSPIGFKPVTQDLAASRAGKSILEPEFLPYSPASGAASKPLDEVPDR
jgi:hypothetical protein